MSRLTNSQWIELICQCRDSGLSPWKWCRRNNIPRTSFYYHLRKLSSSKTNPMDIAADSIQSTIPVKLTEANEIVPLIIRDDENDGSSLDLNNKASAKITINGITVDLYNNIERNALINILSAVNQL